MTREEKKEQTRQAFIAATKQIIETQGVQYVTARSVGELAGYSYASIYNYYADIDDLLVATVIDYMDQSHTHMLRYVKPDMTPEDKLYALAKGYVSYLYEHPELFRVIFIRDYGDHTVEQAMKMLPKTVMLIRSTLAEIGEDKLAGSVDDIFKLLSSATHGKLMFHVLGRDKIRLDQMLDSIQAEIDIILGRKFKS